MSSNGYTYLQCNISIHSNEHIQFLSSQKWQNVKSEIFYVENTKQ